MSRKIRDGFPAFCAYNHLKDITDEINKIDMKYINLAIEVFGKNRDIDDILIFAKTYNKIDSKLKSIN